MTTTLTNQPIDLIHPGEAATPEGWWASAYDAGFTTNMNWSPSAVRSTPTGGVELVLDAAPTGSSRPYMGGEAYSQEVASTGTWTWTAQVPRMVDGSVFGMFTYKEDYWNDPWLEFDFEFVGADTTKVQLNIHMEHPDANGQMRKTSLSQLNNWAPIVVDLGFDASQGLHTYDIVVTQTDVRFVIDGLTVGRFDAGDMGGIWVTGPMKGVADLYCVDQSLSNWAGTWSYPGVPLVATIAAMDVRPGDWGSAPPAPRSIEGTVGDDVLGGTDGDDVINGRAGDDALSGGLGHDALSGNAGGDALELDAGDDALDGGAGVDWVRVAGPGAAVIDLALATSQDTGFGRDTLLNIEGAWGGSGDDALSGTDGANGLRGGSGSDTLLGRGGNDVLEGGLGNDALDGGAGNDILDGGAGADWLRNAGSGAVKVDLTQTAAQATGRGTDVLRGIENVAGGSGADRLLGDRGANVLEGAAGNDLLQGRSGADTLVGGLGRDVLHAGHRDGERDTIVFLATTDSAPRRKGDTVREFEAGAFGLDVIDLSAIDANSWTAANDAFTFSGTGARAHSMWCFAGRSDVRVRADVTGDQVADFEVRLIRAGPLTADDFVL